MLGMSESVGTDRPRKHILVLDIPTYGGYDPDEPEAQGRVGREGISISTIKDLEAIFDGVPVDEVETLFVAYESTISCIAMYITYAERRGIPQERLRIRANKILYGQWLPCFALDRRIQYGRPFSSQIFLSPWSSAITL